MIVMVLVVLGLVLAALIAWLAVETSYRAPVHADEVHMVTTADLWRIRLCRHKPRGGRGEPVLLCHGFMSNQYNFANPPGESMADALAAAGYDSWLIDLRGARSSVPPFGRSLNDPAIDDYLLRDIPAALEYIRKATGYPKAHWVGHSMGGMLLYAYDAVFGPARLASGTTLGSPIGFAGVIFRRPTELLLIRRVSRTLFRCFQRILVSILETFHPNLTGVPINWNNMNPKMDARALFSMVEAPPIRVAEDLVAAVETRTWRVNGGQVNVFAELRRLRVPLLAIFGAGDPLVPVHTVRAFFDAIRNSDKKLLILAKENDHAADYSHVDLVVGPRCKAEVFDPIVAWFRAHPIEEDMTPDKDTASRPVERASRRRRSQASRTKAGKPGKRTPAGNSGPASNKPA
jgi:pimeloyl-ACP methyl ester carboxylesterase